MGLSKLNSGFHTSINELIHNIFLNSFYADFLFRQININIQRVFKEKAGGYVTSKDGDNFVKHKVPFRNPKFKFLPWKADKYLSEIIPREMNELADWLLNGGDFEHFFDIRDNYYSEKQGRIIKKILSLSEEFSDHLLHIAETDQIPFESLINIYKIITADVDHINKRNLIFFKTFKNILVSKDIPRNERDKFLLQTADKIFNLLSEIFWVLIIIDLCEFYQILSFLKYNHELNEIKSYLLDEACFLPIEDEIQNIASEEELYKYVAEKYMSAMLFHPKFIKFISKLIIKKSERLIKIKDAPVYFKSEYSTPDSKKGEKRDLDNINTHNDNQNVEPNWQDLSSTKTPFARREYRQHEIDSLANIIMHGNIEKKLNKGLLMAYKLKGQTNNLLAYLIKIIDNASREELCKEYDKKIKEHTTRSVRTLKRYLKEINIENDGDSYNKIKNISDLALSEIDSIVKEKELKKKHEKEGFITQRKLLSFLCNDDFLQKIKKYYGINFKKYSETTLKKKLKELKSQNKINFIKEKVAVYYNHDDIISIVQEISKISR